MQHCKQPCFLWIMQHCQDIFMPNSSVTWYVMLTCALKQFTMECYWIAQFCWRIILYVFPGALVIIKLYYSRNYIFWFNQIHLQKYILTSLEVLMISWWSDLFSTFTTMCHQDNIGNDHAIFVRTSGMSS